MRLFESNRGSVSPSISHQIYHINSISFRHNFLSFQVFFHISSVDIFHFLCYTIDVEIQPLIRTRRHRIMIIDMEKYRHGHCRGSHGAAQGIAAQAIGTAPAASVLEPISFPGEVANVLKLNPVPTPSPTLLCYGQCWQPCGQAANTAPAMR